MRLILDWEMAVILPTIMVNAASIQRMSVISAERPGNAIVKTRNNAAKPAIFAPDDINAVTAVGEP